MTAEVPGGGQCPMTPYTVIRSNRRTLSLEITPKGLIVRAPYSASDEQIAETVKKHGDWIKKHAAGMEEALRSRPPAERLTAEEIRKLADDALKVIPERVAHYAPLVGVTYSRITIRNQRSKWGSCSSKGGLNFNCLLMLAPPEVRDSVVVHELCHRKHMNHSSAFYEEVLRVLPDYKAQDKWLKKNGLMLMARLGK